MITPDELYEVNKLKTARKDYADLLRSFESKYVQSKVGIVGINTNKPTITDQSAFFHWHFKDLEAELTEVVKAKLVAEIAEIDLKIAVYIGDEPIMPKLTDILSQPEGENWKLRAEEASLRNQILSELVVAGTIRTNSAQEALKQSNLRWVRLENGNWTRRPEEPVAATPKEEAIDEPEKKVNPVTHKWEQFESSGPSLPVFFTPWPLETMLPSFATVDYSKPKPPGDE
jgi:hypothetical protein